MTKKIYTIETLDGKLYNNPTTTTKVYFSAKKRDKVLNDEWHKNHAAKNGLVLIPKTYELVEAFEFRSNFEEALNIKAHCDKLVYQCDCDECERRKRCSELFDKYFDDAPSSHSVEEIKELFEGENNE